MKISIYYFYSPAVLHTVHLVLLYGNSPLKYVTAREVSLH